MKLASYKAADRARLEAFLRRQQTFAALNGQTIDAFSEENGADFEADGTISLLVEADAEVIAVVDLLRRLALARSVRRRRTIPRQRNRTIAL